METTQIYAIAAGGVIVLLMIMNVFSLFKHGVQSLNMFRSKYLTYPLVVQRHRFLGPWSPADIIVQSLYPLLNSFCLFFRVASLKEVGNRAGTLSMTNMAPLFFGLHLSFLADLFGLSLSNCRRIHRSAGLMSMTLLIVHIFIALKANPISFLRAPEHLYLIIGASSFGLLMVLSLRFVRRISYEFFLRTHQILAFLSGYVIWRHVHSASLLNRVILYVSTGIFCSTTALQLFAVVYRNNLRRGSPPQAAIYRVGCGYKIRLMISRRLKVQVGQYINLWMPSIGFWSFLQSHPFVVTSCGEGDRTMIELLVEPWKGFTSKLQQHTQYGGGHEMERSRMALFTGPHGASAPLGDFDRVLIVASGCGIVAHLPYLRHLIRGYNDFSSRTRRIHLVWQLENIQDGAPAQEYLNQALKEDALDDSYILRISIYYASGDIERGSFNEGHHRRVSAHKGLVSMEDVLRAEVLGDSQSGKIGEEDTLTDGKPALAMSNPTSTEEASDMLTERKGGEMLVMVSGSQSRRDDLRSLVRSYLDGKLKLLETDYQPNV